MAIALLLLFAASFLVTIALVPFVIRLSLRKGFVDLPGGRKIHGRPTPLGGGLAMAATLLSMTALVFIGAWLRSRCESCSFVPVEFEAFLPMLPKASVVVAGGLLILALGLIDDKRHLSAGFKLLIETFVAAGFVAGVERLELFASGNLVLDIAASCATIFWIVLLINSMNLLDHFDGLCGGVAAIIALSLLIPAIQTGQWPIAAALVVLCGSMAGFLPYNFPPAKIFLGDAGSLLSGYAIAVITILFTFYREPYPIYSYFVPLVVLAVPLFDTMGVVAIRLRRGKPLFEADTNHLAHRLAALGMRPLHVLLVIYSVTLCAGVSASLLYVVGFGGAMAILAQILLLLLVVALFLAAPIARGRE